MNLTKVLAGTTALTLASAGLALGMTTGSAQASSDSFTVVKQINNVTLNAPEILSGGKTIDMTVTPATADPGDPIEVVITSPNLDFDNGPTAQVNANVAELDAVIHLDGKDYTLRGSQNTQVIPPNDESTATTPILFKGGWKISSKKGASSSTSSNGGANTSVAGTTGIGSQIRGAEAGATAATATTTPLVAPGPGNYTIGLKAFILNLVVGDSSTPLITNNFDSVYNTSPQAEWNGANCPNTAAPPAQRCYGPGGVNGSFALNTVTFNGTEPNKGNFIFATPVTIAVTGTLGPPGKPGTPVGIADDGKVGVSWNAASSNGFPITKSVVTADPGGKTCTVNDASTACIVEDLTNGTAYTFTVVSTNSEGDGPESDASAPVTPRAPTAPGAPTNVKASAGSGVADVSWSAPSSNGGSGITAYTVTSTPGGKNCSVLGTPPTSLTCTVAGLTNGTSYTFRVTATNALGTSVPSAPSAAVTPGGTTPTEAPGEQVDDGPRSATSTVKAYCDVKAAFALAEYNFPLTITVTPGAAKPGNTVEVTVANAGSPNNTGPTTLKVGGYRFEATVSFEGKSSQLIGPLSKFEAAPEGGQIFKASELPTVAKGTITLPDTEGEFPVTVKDLWYNNIPVDATETDRSTGLNDTFDNRCNSSNKPRTAPKAFAAPVVEVEANENAAGTTLDPESGTGAAGESGGVLAATGAGELVALGLLALAALQVGAIVAVRAQRSSPRTKRVRLH